jgi:hypothetical protein
MGLEAIEREIDRDVEIQKANLAKRERLLGMRRDAAQSTFQTEMEASRSAEVHRQALYQQAIRGLQVEMQKYDPRGTTWRRIADNAADMQARQQAARAKWEQQNFENELKLQEFGLKNRDQLLKEKKAAGVGGGAAKPKVVDFDDVPRTADQLRQLGINIPEGVTLPPEGISLNNVKKLALSGKSAEDWNKATRENKPEELYRSQVVAAPPRLTPEGALDRNTGNLKQADGSDWILPTGPEGIEFRKKKTAADSIVGILDGIRAIRADVGGELSWGNSPAYGRLQTLKENLVLLKKAGTQGMSSDADMARIERALGADNPASFRDQAAKLDEGRAQVESQLNIDARNLGYTGADIRYPDPVGRPKAAKTATEKEIENILSVTDDGLGGNDFAEKKTGTPGQRTTRAIQASIDRLRAVVSNEEASAKDREIAREGLERIANEAQSKAVREYATANAVEFNIPSPEEPR